MKDQTNLRALIVGANGQVGAQIVRELGSEHVLPSSWQARKPGWFSLDLATLKKSSELEGTFAGVKLGAIYCVGGMTNVELCETEPDLAMRTNCTGPALLAKLSRRRGLPFVYFSTEYVFDGRSGPYDEASPTCPISVYGRSKWEGELAVQASNPEALIIRTTVVYGPDHGAKNFLYALRRKLSAGESFSIPEDQLSTPTYNRDLARATVGLMNKKVGGVFHVCGPERMSRLEFSRRAATFWGLDCNNIHGVPTNLLGQKAARPLKAGLNIGKLQTLHPDLPMAGLEASLEDWQRAENACELE